MKATGNLYPGLRKHAWLFVLIAGAALSLARGAASADEVFQARTQISLPGGQKITSFDISFVDPVIGVYILADRTNKAVDLIDTTTNTVLVQLTSNFAGATPSNDNAGPDGAITVNHREVWAGDGPSVVKVINLFSQATTHMISTGGVNRADELCADPEDQLVLVANDAESPFPFVSIISTVNYSVLKRITMDGTVALGGTIKSPAATNGIEQCQWDDRTSKFYVNIPEVNGPGNDTQPGAVVTISPKTLQIVDVFSIPIANCAGPQGMAIGPEHQILLGCNDPNKTVPSTVVIDDRNGGVLAAVPNEDGADEVWYNSGDDQYFLARSGGLTGLTLAQQLGVIDATKKLPVDQSVDTGLPNLIASPHGTAHSVAADPVFNQVYVPIPSTAGGTVCSGGGGSDAQGCIAVFTAAQDDEPSGSN